MSLERIEVVDPLRGSREKVFTSRDNCVRSHNSALTLSECEAVPCPSGRVRVRFRFLTQTRLQQGDAIVRQPEFYVLFRRLLGRIFSMARFHGSGPLEVNFRGLIERAHSVRLVQDETCWTTWARFSFRQQRRMEWEGIVGDAVYEGDLSPFWS